LSPDEFVKKFIVSYNDDLLLSKISINNYNKIISFNDIYLNEFKSCLINSIPKNRIQNNLDLELKNKNKIAILALDFIEDILFMKIIEYFNNYSFENYFDIYFITDYKSKVKYPDNIFFINSSETNLYIDNIQIFIDYLLKNRILDNYDGFIFVKKDILNDPKTLIDLNNISYDTFDFIAKNNKSCGIIENFEYTYVIDSFMIDEIYNNNIIFLNKQIIESLDYNFINYEINDIFDNMFNNDIVFKIKLNKISKDKLFKNIINGTDIKNINDINLAKEKIKALINEYYMYFKLIQNNLTSFDEIKLANFTKDISDEVLKSNTEIDYNNYERKNINFLECLRRKIYS